MADSTLESRANTNHVFITNQQWNVDIIRKNQTRVVKLLKDYYTGNSLQALKDIKKMSLVITPALGIS